MARTLSAIKNALVPHGTRPRTVRLGLLSGIRLNLDLSNGMQIYTGLSERELAPWFKRLASGIRSAFDVGTADGTYTLFLLGKTPVERVFAFEPDPDAEQRLRANLQLNGFEGSPRLTVIPKFVAAADDDRHCTLDSFGGDAEQPILVKLDIEGFEGEALAGASALLGKADVRWIVEVHSRELERSCQALFRSHGYHVEEIPRASFRAILPELRPGDHNAWFVAFRPQLVS